MPSIGYFASAMPSSTRRRHPGPLADGRAAPILPPAPPPSQESDRRETEEVGGYCRAGRFGGPGNPGGPGAAVRQSALRTSRKQAMEPGKNDQQTTPGPK